MKKTFLRYGIYGGIAELALFLLTYVVIWLFNPSHIVQGYIGWVNLVCPLLFVYFGMRYYRDQENNGALTFMQAIRIGLLIVIIPAVAFGLIETIFVSYIEPDFYDKIAKYDLEQYRKTLSPQQFAAKAKEMQESLEANKNPLTNFVMTSIAVAAIGVIMTLISAVILMKKPKQKTAIA